MLISVIIPVFNSEKYIYQTLTSILNQTYNNFEIIIVDDGSTDNSREIISSIKSKKIKYILFNENSGGPSKPRNRAILEAKGDLISIFDSDDVMAENKLEETEKLFSKYNFDFLFTNFRSIDENDNIICDDYLNNYNEFRKLLVRIDKNENCYLLVGDVYIELLKANFIGTSSVVFRRSLFDEIGFFR